MKKDKAEMRKVFRHAFVLFFAFAVIVSFSTTCATQDSESKVKADMDAYLKSVNFNGSALVAAGGEVLLSRGYGMANFEHDVPNTPQTIFRIGSMSKQFTAMAILQLQEMGKLNVMDPISDYMDIPEIWEGITIHHLLSHTSGIPIYYSYPEYYGYSRYPIAPKELVETVWEKPLHFKPGEACSYSCTNFTILGYLIEVLSGLSYADFLQENIFLPLEMRDSGYDQSSPIIKNRASGYYWKADGKLANAGYIHMTAPYAAGALYSTVEDMYKWDRAQYTEKLVSQQSLNAMFTPHTYSAEYGGFHNGYGVWVSERKNRKIVGHAGGVNGFSTFFERYVDDDVCVIVLSNTRSAWPGPARVSHDLAAMVFGEEYELPPEEEMPEIVGVDPALYDAFIGQYEYNYIITITKRDNRLYLQGSWQPEIEIFPISETAFVLKGAQLTFVKNEEGQVTHCIFRSGGIESICKKIK
ncbi:serine hydrolase [Acidobacteriota bacterium]